jgi:uncharacterized membrane protein
MTVTDIISKFLPTHSDSSKRLWATSEFWVALLAAILIPANKALDLNLPIEAILGVIAIAISYVTSRTLAKSSGEKIRAGVRTTEFWVTVLSSVALFLSQQLGFDLAPDQVAAIVTLIVSAIVGRGAVKKIGTPSPALEVLAARELAHKWGLPLVQRP